MEQSKAEGKEGDKTNDELKLAKEPLPLGLVFGLCVIGSLLLQGWKAVFIGIAIAPIDTLLGLVGMAIPFYLFSYVVARIVKLIFRKISLRYLWIACSTALIVMILVGQWQGATGS